MIKLFFVNLAMVILTSCHSQDTLKISVKKGFCGKIIIVGQKTSTFSNCLIPDHNGIAYINEEIFKRNVSIKIISGDNDITDSCKEVAQGIVDLLDKKRIRYLSFFVPCDDEKKEDDEYWHQRSSSDALEGKINIMIDEGKIKIK